MGKESTPTQPFSLLISAVVAFSPTWGTIAHVNAGAKTRAWWAAVIALLLLAFAVRVWDLESVPPGLTHDEASNGHDSTAILRGVHRIYFPVGYGHEPLYDYSVALTTLFLGQGIFTLRITTVLWGLAQCILVAALARRWWGRFEALVVVAAYAVSFWALMLSRVGLRAPALPALLAASVLAYSHATSAATTRRATGWYALSGLALGASFYTYMASRGMPLLFAGVLVVALISDRPRFRRIWRGTLLTLATAAAAGAPLFVYLRAHPDLETRIGQLGEAVTALTAGDTAPIRHNIVDSLPMLLWHGDPYWLYNVAGRPGLEPLLAATLVVGVVAALARLRDERRSLLVIWLAGGVAPALIAPVAYNLLHAVAAMPAAMLLVALGARELKAQVGRLRRPVPHLVAAAAGIAWALTGTGTAQAYFGTWAHERDVQVAYHSHVVALGHELDRTSETTPVVMTSLYPGEFHDPYVMEVTLHRSDLSLRWVDGRGAIFVPTTSARLFVEEQTQLPPALWRLLLPDLEPSLTLSFGDDAIPSWTRGYAWDAPASWQALTSGLATEILAQRGDPPPAAEHARLRAPVGFGEIVSLAGYRTTQTPSGDALTLSLLTAWTVTAPVEDDLAIFAHLLDAGGNLVSQDDRLDAPSWQWQPGDRFVQVHSLALPADLPSGSYVVELGLYARGDLARLPIHMTGPTGDCVATRVLLPVELTAQAAEPPQRPDETAP